jgi:hypothetical protein
MACGYTTTAAGEFCCLTVSAQTLQILAVTPGGAFPVRVSASSSARKRALIVGSASPWSTARYTVNVKRCEP